MTDRLYRFSATEDFMRCRRSFMINYIRNLEPLPYDGPDKVAGPMAIGSCGHAAMAAWYRGEGKFAAFDAMKAYAEDNDFADTAEHQIAIDTFTRYLSYIETTQIDRTLTPIMVEERLYLDLGGLHGDHVVLTGEPDLVVRDHFGLVRILDHKFVARFGTLSGYVDKNRQGMTYALMAQDALNEPVTSFTLNQISKKPAKANPIWVDRVTATYRPEQLEAHRAYLIRCVSDMVKLTQEVEQGDTVGCYPSPANCCGSFVKQNIKVCDELNRGNTVEAERILLTNYKKREPLDAS